ncbi:MAG TPA: TlpA disulfide reductase family protein [Draconibacterium sp.]|nr:TlpA disulfide reductase family protein [Draconibacterium sp.]
MRKLLIALLSVVLFACSQQKGYKISVQIDGAEGEVTLGKAVGGQLVGVDTAVFVNGVAVLEGEVEYPEMLYMSLNGGSARKSIFVENTEMSVTGKIDSIDAIIVSGSTTHNEYKSLNDEMSKIAEEYMAVYQEARKASVNGDTAQVNILMNQVEEIYGSIFKLQEDFIREHPASYVTPSLLAQIEPEMDGEKLAELVSSLDPKLEQLPVIIEIKNRIEKMKILAVGKIAPDFTQNDTEGNPVKFSDIYSKNELTLIDFWAAWCGPCRAENPNVVSTYQKYKDQGFGVLGVSLDQDKAAWLKAIEDDGLTWNHVSDLAYWNNAAAELYAVRSIPASFLVDKNGKIVAKNKRGEELQKTVESFLAN